MSLLRLFLNKEVPDLLEGPAEVSLLAAKVRVEGVVGAAGGGAVRQVKQRTVHLLQPISPPKKN